MATATQQIITAEEFLKMPGHPTGLKQELVRGEVVTMCVPGFDHGLIQVQVCLILREFVKAHNLGRVTVESGIVTERDPDTVRGPDVAYWSTERLPLDQRPRGYPEMAPDLCVEILSPSNRPGKVRDKVREYFARSVRMVWLIDPEDRAVRVYRSLEEGRLFHEGATLDGEDVLPGFSCRVAEIFA